MAHKLDDNGRRDLTFFRRKIKEVLPEYFRAEYPDLITFLEGYYDFMLQENGPSAFDLDIEQLYRVRDIPETELANLNRLIKELGGNNLENGDLFEDPRFTARRFADFYRSKGTRNSIREFFRAFFQQEVEVEYGKKSMFFVGESKIGFDSLKFIQNYELYQVFGLLIKTGLGTKDWDFLYKKFVHPAGFYFQGQVVNEGQANLNIGNMPISLVDSSIGPAIVGEAFGTLSVPFTQDVVLFDNPKGGKSLARIDGNLISTYQSFTANSLITNYNTIEDLFTPNQPGFDDSAADFTATTFTFDGSIYTREDTEVFTYRMSSTGNTMDRTSETFDDDGSRT